MSLRQKILFKMINYWPPFLGAGIHVDYISDDFRAIDVSLKLRFWNRNYVNTQFGGSLYSMTDPFYMLMLMRILGPEFIIWDKSASIRFKKPGRSKVFARFRLDEEKILELKQELTTKEKIEPILHVLVVDENNEVIAEVDKLLYIRRKKST
jgi:hypothetical protein